MDKKKILDFFRKQGALLALILLVAVALIRFPVFRQVDNLLNILVQNSMIGIIAVAMTLVIITGGIDLSVGAVAALSSVLLASVSGTNNALLIFGLPIIVGIVLGILITILAVVFSVAMIGSGAYGAY